MAEQNTGFHGPDTPEAFLADRQRFWNGFTRANVITATCVAVLLIGMAIFLL